MPPSISMRSGNRRSRRGLLPRSPAGNPIDRLQRQFGNVKDREPWGGVALIVIGGLYLLGNLDVFDLRRVARLWPAALVVVGVWLLKKHQDKEI